MQMSESVSIFQSYYDHMIISFPLFLFLSCFFFLFSLSLFVFLRASMKHPAKKSEWGFLGGLQFQVFDLSAVTVAV